MRSLVLFSLLISFAFLSKAQKYLVPLSDQLPSSKHLVSESKVKLSYSYAGLNIQQIETPEGVFNEIIVPNTYKAGNVGEPQLVSTNKIFTVPSNAIVSVKVNAFTTHLIPIENYTENNKLIPLQPPISKRTDKPTKFELNKLAYEKDVYTQQTIAEIKVLGKMRDKQIVKLIVNPVQYNPVKNIVKLFNDIDLEISLSSPINITKSKPVKTNSPYFNEHATRIEPLFPESKYADHPDLINYPVTYLIVTPNEFVDELNEFIEWKTQKGFNVVVGNMDVIGNTSTEIKAWVHDQYNSATAHQPAPSFLLLVGDVAQVPVSQLQGTRTGMETDLYYASVDGDMFPEMYYGRMPAQNEQQLLDMLQKTLYYERYEFTDDSFLNDVTLIAGADGTWNPRVGQPTVNYATNFYFNSNNGFANVNAYLTSYSGCYNTDKIGVGLINYTAHCSQTSWQNPSLSANTIRSANNLGKYGIAIGNCCTSGDFAIDECIGEAFVRNPNGGAVAYIGSVPDTYWWEDFYWAVGAHSPVYGQYPDTSASSMGVYDAPFVSNYHTVDAMVFVGNLSVTEAHNEGYNSDINSLYYWEAYHCLGDPSVTPYIKQGIDNEVKHDSTFKFGINTFQVQAAPGSSVALSNKNGLIATEIVDYDSVALLATDTLTLIDTVTLIVTKANYKPYIKKVPIGAVQGTYLVLSDIQFIDTLGNGNAKLDYSENGHLNIIMKNIGDQTSQNIYASLTSNSSYIDSLYNNIEIPLGNLASESTDTIKGSFYIELKDSLPDLEKINFTIHLSDSVSGASREFYTYNYNATVHAPIIDVIDYVFIDDFTSNGNYSVDFGEAVQLDLAVANYGSADISLDAFLVNNSVDSLLQINTYQLSDINISSYDTTIFTFEVSLPAVSDTKEGDTLYFRVSDGIYLDDWEFNVPFGQDMLAQIGADDSTAVKYPFYNYYKSNISQLLVLNNEFGYGIKAIKSLAFDVNRFTDNEIHRDLSDFKITAGYTSVNELLSAQQPESEKIVFSRSTYNLPDSNGWTKIDFDSSFIINDDRNLLFEIVWGLNDNFSTETTSTTVKASETSFKSVVWGASDNTNPPAWEGSSDLRPNMQFEFDSVGIINVEVSGDLAINGNFKIENCGVSINGNTKYTNDIGRTGFYFVEHQGNYSISFDAYGYKDSVISINKTETYEHINMQLKRNPELHLKVTNAYNIPLSNIDFTVNGMIFSTDGNGETYCYNNEFGNYSTIIINTNDFLPYTDSTLISGVENYVHIKLVDKFSNLTVQVVNVKGKAIEQALVIANGQEKTTDSLGQVTFNNLLKADHVIQIYHDSYVYKVDTVSVENESDTVFVELKSKNSLLVSLSSQGTTLSNFEFLLNDSAYITDAGGNCVFNNLAEGSYIIAVNNHEYYAFSDTASVFDSVTVMNIDLLPKANLSFYINGIYFGLSNIELKLNDTSFVSDSLGMIQIPNLEKGFYVYEVNTNGYYPVLDSFEIAYVDTVVNVLLKEIPDIEVFIVGVENSISDMEFNFNGELFYPNSEGRILIKDVGAGVFSYSINHSGNYPIVDSITVADSNVFLEIALQTIPDVKFAVGSDSCALQAAAITLNGITKQSDAVGEAVFSDIPAGEYTYTVSKMGFENIEKLLSVDENDTIINVDMRKMASVTFIVSAEQTKIGNAAVTFDSLTYYTSLEGEVSAQNVAPGEYLYTVSFKGYDIFSDSIEVSTADITEFVNLVQSRYNLTLSVTGGGNVIENAEVLIDGNAKLTDDSGKVTYNDLPGNSYYRINISKEKYLQLYDSVFILDRDVTVNFDLSPIYYNVEFAVTDTNGILEGANITFNSKVKQTNEQGKALFVDVMPDTNLMYFVRKTESHITDTGHLNLVCDTIINVRLVLIPIIGINHEQVNLWLYPNPSKGKLIIQTDTEVLGSEYRIYNSAGKTVKHGSLKTLKTIIDLYKHDEGIYFIRFFIHNKQVTHSFILE